MIEVHPQLFDAARAGDLPAVQQIVNSWTTADRRFGYTLRSPSWAVIIALREGHLPVVRWLLESGWAVRYYVKVYLVLDAENNGALRLDDAARAVLGAHKLI